MSTKIQIIKRLEIVKTAIELEEEDLVHLQIKKLKEENNDDLDEIIEVLENDDYSNINKVIDDYIYGYKNAKLTPHQQEVFNAINRDIDQVLQNYQENELKTKTINFFSLSGSAGVGKTFVTAKLVESFLSKEYKILLTTPTHKSLSVAKYMINSNNIQVNAKTLQSYLDLRLDINYFQGTKAFTRDKKQNQYDYEKDLDILIVDESSMVSNELLKFIEENLEQNKLKTVLFIGDQYQLPPVDEGSNGVVLLPKHYILSEIVRQAKDSYIKIIANELKNCIRDQKYIPLNEILNPTKHPQLQIFHDEKSFLQDFTKEPQWYEKKKIAISYTNSQVDEQNRLLRYKYWLDNGITVSDAIIVGDSLVFNESYDKRFQNSEVVLVTKAERQWDKYIQVYYWQCLDGFGRSFKVIDPDYAIEYNNYLSNLAAQAKKVAQSDRELRKKKWGHYFATKETYADVKYTFASTVHKVQGSTYDIAYINAASIASMINRNEYNMAYRLLYVAITRASRDIKILL